MPWTRRALLGVIVVGMIGTAACGHAARAAGRSGGRGGPAAVNPAMRAALEIIRVAPVVPFTPEQVEQLVPMLQGLAANPDQTPSQLATEAQQIEAVFTDAQKTALANLASAGGFQRGQGQGGGFGGGQGRTGGGRPGQVQAGGGQFRRGTGTTGGGSPAGDGHGQPRAFSPSSVYQAAIATLQGTGPGSTTTPA